MYCVVIYPSTIEEWQSVECLSGKIVVYHTEIGSILYGGKLPSALASEGIFFYEFLYVLPIVKCQYGQLHPIPPPSLDSVDWPFLSLDVAASFKLKIVGDIQGGMKPSTGAKGVHLSWAMPLSCFAFLFKSCVGAKKTRYTYTCKDLDVEWLDSCRGLGYQDNPWS